MNNFLPSGLLQSPEPSLYVNAIKSKVRHSDTHGLGIGVVVTPGFGGPGGGRGRGGARPVEVKYEASAWGRYAKVLLSSTEFIFVN